MVKCGGVSPNGSRQHTPGRVGRERAMTYAQRGFGGDKYTREQASVFLIHGYVASYSYVLTGRKCTGCYPVQCRQLGHIALRPSDCTEDRRRSKHTRTAARSRGGYFEHSLIIIVTQSRARCCSLPSTPTYNGGRRRARSASKSAFCGARSALP